MNLESLAFEIRPDIVLRREPDGAFLYDPRTAAVHGVNRTGAFICSVLKAGARRTADIHAEMAGQYDVDPADQRLKTDVEAFLHHLLELNLLSIAKQ